MYCLTHLNKFVNLVVELFIMPLILVLFYFLLKFLSHPVVYNLLEKVWRGRFAGLRSKYRWKWTLLKLYSLLDIVLFPFVFTFLFVTHSINVWRRKSKGLYADPGNFGHDSIWSCNSVSGTRPEFIPDRDFLISSSLGPFF